MDNDEHPTAEAGPRVTRDEVKDVARLRRSRTDRHIAGVAGGLARHLDIDPILVRVGLVVAVFFGGAGLLIYAAAWILVPEEGTNDQPLGLDERSRVYALLGAGVLALLAAIGDWAGAFWFPWPVAIVALLVLWFVNRSDSSTDTYPDTYTGSPPPYAPVTYGYEQAGETGQPVSYARPRPRNPRKRGPLLLWFTLALIALAEGVLGVVDTAGAQVTPSAYPALALAVTTAMLLLGAFWGRAGGLILVGLVAAFATLLVTAGHQWEDTTVYEPERASEVSSTYELPGGELILDLSGVRDVEGLDGRTVDIDGFAGRIEVIVPDDTDVAVSTNVVGGDIRVFGQRENGGDASLDGFIDGGAEAPDLNIGIDLVFGEIVVREN